MITRWSLTEREQEVMNLVAIECVSHKEAAYRLGLSGKTIQKHLDNVREKMQARSTPQAVLWWMRERIAHEQFSKEVARAAELRASYCHCPQCNGFGFVPKAVA